MTITLDKSLILFPLCGELASTRELPPGSYKVQSVANPIGGKEKWLRLKGEKWGNALPCWQAATSDFKSHPPVAILLNLVRRSLLALALVWIMLMPIKTNWSTQLGNLRPTTPASTVDVAISTFLQGSSSIEVQQANQVIQIAYTAGWKNIELWLRGQHPQPFSRREIIQIHREALLLLFLGVLLGMQRSARFLLQIILPTLFVRFTLPIIHPTVDMAIVFYYPAILATTLLFIWNTYPILQPVNAPRQHWTNKLINWTGILAGILLLIHTILTTQP